MTTGFILTSYMDYGAYCFEVVLCLHGRPQVTAQAAASYKDTQVVGHYVGLYELGHNKSEVVEW